MSHPNNIVFSYLNINSIRNKLDDLSYVTGTNVDVLCVAETKLDDSFMEGQFCLEGFRSPFRLDKSGKSGGLLIYVKSNLPSRLLTDYKLPNDIQLIPIELNLRKDKWFVISLYRPPRQSISYFIEHLSYLLDFYASKYSNVLIMGDFNETATSTEISKLISEHSLYSLVSTPTCFKSVGGRCIDLILTNKKNCFQKSGSVETGVSDHHHLIYTMLKKTVKCLPPRKVCYRSYKRFSEENFRSEVILLMNTIRNGDFSSFYKGLTMLLDKHAPIKTKILRGNNQPHVNKALRKEIMKRSRLKNVANKTGKLEDFNAYKKQRNIVVNLNRKSKKLFFKNVEIDGTYNRKSFWDVCKPMFSTKFTGPQDRVLLTENEKNIFDDFEISNIFNNYFVNITSTLPIVQWAANRPSNSVGDVITKYRDHPSILKIHSLGFNDTFKLDQIQPWETYKAILSLDAKKSTSGPIPTKMLHLIAQDCYIVLTECLNTCIQKIVFRTN